MFRQQQQQQQQHDKSILTFAVRADYAVVKWCFPTSCRGGFLERVPFTYRVCVYILLLLFACARVHMRARSLGFNLTRMHILFAPRWECSITFPESPTFA